jgi:hypothetical protein
MKTFAATLCALTLVLASTAFAAPPLVPPGQAKLPAPENVVCPVVGTDVIVAWDLIADANAYQVEMIGILADGSIIVDSDFLLAPPDVIVLDDFAALTVHVRALPAPKHAGGPLQAGAPKGIWSEPCVVEIPAPVLP